MKYIGGKCGRCQNIDFQKANVEEKIIFTKERRLQYLYENKKMNEVEFKLEDHFFANSFTIIAYGTDSNLHQGLVQGCGDTLVINHSYRDGGDSFFKRIR